MNIKELPPLPPMPEPDSYLFQHEETGQTMFVDSQQVEWGFEKINPRLKKISGAFTEAQLRDYALQAIAQAPQAESEPVAGPTTYHQRFTEVVSLLCRAAPPADMVEGWLTPDADDHRLQEWAIEHSPNWSQGIGVLDAAHVMADQPAEGEGHETRNTHPAPGVPDDSKRLDYLQDRGATIDLIAGVANFYPMQFRVGGLHSSANIDVRAAIDTAMLTAAQAQKSTDPQDTYVNGLAQANNEQD